MNTIEATTPDQPSAKARGDSLLALPEELIVEQNESGLLYDSRSELAWLPEHEELTTSLDAQGNLLPVIVRRDGDRYIVVDGRQRVRCALEVNRRRREDADWQSYGQDSMRLRCRVVRGSDDDILRMVFAANIRVNDTPLVRAKKFQHALNLGKTPEWIAQALGGIRPSTVRSAVQLLDCCDEVQKAVDEGRLAETVARGMVPLSHDEQRKALAEMEATGELQGQKARDRVRRRKEEKKGNFDKHMAARLFLERKIKKLPEEERVKVFECFCRSCGVYLGRGASRARCDCE